MDTCSGFAQCTKATELGSHGIMGGGFGAQVCVCACVCVCVCVCICVCVYVQLSVVACILMSMRASKLVCSLGWGGVVSSSNSPGKVGIMHACLFSADSYHAYKQNT